MAGILNTVFVGKDALIRYIQKVVGYCLTGDTSDQCLFILHGEGENGKTTFLETIRMLLGDYAYQTGFSTFLIHKNGTSWHELARLRGRDWLSRLSLIWVPAERSSNKTGHGRR